MSENIYYVYEWIRLDTNEPFYVGKGKNDRWRWKQRSEWFTRIVNKTDVAVNLVSENLSEEEAFEIEIYCIWYYRDCIGYDLVNFTDGGEGISGHEHSEKTKQLMRKAKLGKPSHLKGSKLSEETKRKMSIAHKGRPSPNKGKVFSESHRQALKENHKGMTGKSHSKETCDKISKGRMGWNPSQATRDKMRNNAIRTNSVSNLVDKRFKKDNIPWNKGRPWTEEERERLSEAHKGYVMPDEQKEKIRISTQKFYDDELKERFPQEYYTAIKDGLSRNRYKKDICEELSITMHNLRRIIEVYERE